MADLDAIRDVLAAYRSTDTVITEEQITAAWDEYDRLTIFGDRALAKVMTLAEQRGRELEALGKITADLRRERDALLAQRNAVIVSMPPGMFCAACPVDTGSCPQCGTVWVREGEVRTGYRTGALASSQEESK